MSRGYFENINRSNTVVNNTVINNYYNNTNVTNVVYANRQVPGAIIAVPTTTFVQSQPVGRSAVRMTREMVASAPVAAVAVVAPTEKSVRGAAAQGDKPPSRVFERPVIARTAPPAAPAGFAAQKQQLEAKPGKPLDDNVRKELKSAAAAPAPVVKVVAQPKAAPPTTLPPAAATAGRAPDGRGKSDERKGAPAPATAGAPVAPTTQGTPAGASRAACCGCTATGSACKGRTARQGRGARCTCRGETCRPPTASRTSGNDTAAASATGETRGRSGRKGNGTTSACCCPGETRGRSGRKGNGTTSACCCPGETRGRSRRKASGTRGPPVAAVRTAAARPSAHQRRSRRTIRPSLPPAGPTKGRRARTSRSATRKTASKRGSAFPIVRAGR